MGAGKKVKYSIELDFTTANAEKSVKAVTGKIKEQLQSIASESNKTKYFEGLIKTVHDVDEQLSQFKTKHGDDFESIYQGIGEGVKREFESVFVYARSEIDKFHEEIKTQQLELANLQQVKKDYAKYSKSAKQAINEENIVGFGRTLDPNDVKNWYHSFDQLLAKKKEFEQVGDTSSKEYLENYVQILKTASGLIKADRISADDATDFGIDQNELYDMADKAKSVLSGLKIEEPYKLIQDKISSVTNNIKDQMKSFSEEMPKKIQTAFSTGSTDEQADKNKKIALSYNELSDKLTEYIHLQEKANSGIEFDNDGKSIEDRILEYENYFDSLAKTKEDLDKIQTVISNFSFRDIAQDEALENLCNILKIDLPTDAQDASSAVTSAFAKITQGADQAANSSKKVMYHLGNLLNGKGTARDTFGDMAENLTTNVAGSRYEKYGYGVFGSGLFGVTDPSLITKRPGYSSFIQSIDISKYNMYMADTEQRAEALADFLSKLQKFSIKQAEPNYTGFDSYLQGIDIDSLYNQFKVVFEQSDLTKEKLQLFIDEMVTLLKQAGLAFDAKTESLDFTNISKEISDSDNISTRFMKMLGFDGVNTGTTSFGGLGQGSVLFDFKKEDIVGYFESVKSAIQDYQNILNQTDGNQWIGSKEQLQQYANNIDAIISKMQEIKGTDAFKDNLGIDETLSKLRQIKENITNILSGNDIGSNNPFETITTDVKSVNTFADQAKIKVKEFLSLANEIKDKSFNLDSAEGNIKVGEYTERLNTAKAALDALGEQGLLTSEQLKTVQDAFNESQKRLSDFTSYYTGYGDGNYIYSYQDEYEAEKAKNDTLESENKNLKEQLSTTAQFDATEKSSEITQLDQLKAKLIEVREAVETKTNAFKEEGSIVANTVNSEVQSLQLFLSQLQEILNQVNLINESFAKANIEIEKLKNVENINKAEDAASKIDTIRTNEIVSQNYALDSTLLSTNGILENILTAISNNESISSLVEPLNSAVTELKSVANGIVEHQKTQRADLSDSSIRIANNYGQLSSIAENAVAGIGDNVQIENMKALADNIVRVKGAVRDTSGVWKGFIVDINESNNAVINAVDEQSKFAKSLNESAEAAKRVGGETKVQEAPMQNDLTKKIHDQTNAFNKYRDNLKDASYISDDFKEKLDKLGISLRQVTDIAGFDSWKNKFSDIQKQITLAKNMFIAQQAGKVNQAKKSLEASFKTSGIKENDTNLTEEQKKIVVGYHQTQAALKAYSQSAQQGNQIELSSLQNVTSEIYKQIEAYKQKNNIVDGSKKTYGTNAVTSATDKYNLLSQVANSKFSDSDFVKKALLDYTAAYQKLIDKQKEFKVGENIGSEREAEFRQLQTACNDCARDLNNLIKASNKFAEDADNVVPVDENFKWEDRTKALQDYVQVQYGASAEIGEFNSKCTELTFTVDKGNKTFTQMTAAINPARNAIGTIIGDTQKATSAFGKFTNELKGKIRSISTYLISMVGIQEVWQQIRQGVTYVKEIDSALTELKKVTDETDQTYQNFLKTASQTASVIGSNVADFTNATADFARLGYTLDEASELAKTASVYKNVGDGINDVSQASESIISTMKAFSIEADNAIGIVDRFNEVGNNFAISSTGIGEAMQRSASALYEAGNTIDESIGLVTAAMKNWLFIQKCIKRMHLIAGKSLESCTTIYGQLLYDGLKTQELDNQQPSFQNIDNTKLMLYNIGRRFNDHPRVGI